MGFNTLSSIFKAVPDNCMFLSFITQWPWGIWLYWLNSCHRDHSNNHVCTYLNFITKLSARNKNWLTTLEHLTLKLNKRCRLCVLVHTHTPSKRPDSVLPPELPLFFMTCFQLGWKRSSEADNIYMIASQAGCGSLNDAQLVLRGPKYAKK